MADTDKQNFRYDGDYWKAAMAKLAEMREQGYDIDMTKVLTAEVDRIRTETVAQTAKRLRLTAGEKPAPVWRKPFARDASTRPQAAAWVTGGRQNSATHRAMLDINEVGK